MLESGQAAPSFSLPSTSGRTVSLQSLRGKKIVLYFYPKDDTPGCTREACDFRDNLARVRKAGAEIFGVSKDTLASHEKFRTKYALPYELLSDEGNVTAKTYGAYGKKKLYGKEVEGTIRSTFLIDEKGRIARVWSPVKVEGHADQVLAALGAADATKPAAATKARAKASTKSALPLSKKGSRATKPVRAAAKAAEPKSLKPARATVDVAQPKSRRPATKSSAAASVVVKTSRTRRPS